MMQGAYSNIKKMMEMHDNFISSNQRKAKSIEPYSRNLPNSGGVLSRRNKLSEKSKTKNKSYLLPSIVSESHVAEMKTFETTFIKL